MLAASNAISIRQHVKVLPKACCACPPCVKQENTYSIYAGLDRNNQAEFLRVDEISDDWNRCCCAPYHPVKLEVRPYIPVPGDNSGSDYSHMTQDFHQSFASMSLTAKYNALKQVYFANPPVMTMIRHDGERCCCKVPCKYLSTFVCCACCQDGMDVYAGGFAEEEGKERGGPFMDQADPSRLIGTAIQPNYGGWCWPTIHLTAANQEPYAKIEGPCCFGGWSEMCCSFNVPVCLTKAQSTNLAN